MRSQFGNGRTYKMAPSWAERSLPRGLLRRDIPSLLLIKLPDQDCYVVATNDESDAIADPGSFMGRLLRAHCALLSLPYISNN